MQQAPVGRRGLAAGLSAVLIAVAGWAPVDRVAWAAGPPAPLPAAAASEVVVPVTTRWPGNEPCSLTLAVQSVGRRPMKVLLALWDGANAPDCAGPCRG